MKRDEGFLDRPGNIRKMRFAFYAALAILLVMDFIIDRHASFGWDGTPGFFALYALLSCAVIVAVAKVLGKFWLKKREDYYD